MRIFSSFNDYYDGVAKVGGYDPTVIFHRKTEVQQLRALEFRYPSILNRQHFHRDVKVLRCLTLIFCGKLFECVELADRPGIFGWNDYDLWHSIFWRYTHDRSYEAKLRRRIHEMRLYLEKDYTEENLEQRAPILLYELRHASGRAGRSLSLSKNPGLAEYGMRNVLDPVMAYQTLDQFIATHLFRNRDLTELSEKSRWEKKGFDSKTSFRKPKQS